MNILFINTLSHPNYFGGAERTVFELASSLANNYDVDVRIIATSISGVHSDEYIDGVRVTSLPIENIYHPYEGMDLKEKSNLRKMLWHYLDRSNNAMKRKVVRCLEGEMPDVVITNCLAGISSSVWDAFEEYDVPIIHILRDYYLLCVKSSMYKHGENCVTRCAICKIYKDVIKEKTAKVASVVGISEFILQKHMDEGYFTNARTRKSVIYNGIKLPPENKTRTLGNGVYSYGYIGQIIPEKGIEEILAVFSERRIRNTKLHVFGNGRTEYVNYLKNKYATENITWHGYTDIDNVFSIINFLIVPSLWNEPFGRVVVEAFLRGVPVLGAARGGITEIIDNSEAGYIFDPNSPSDLTGLILKMNSMSECEYTNMSGKALIRGGVFSNDFMVEKVWKEINAVCALRSKRLEDVSGDRRHTI